MPKRWFRDIIEQTFDFVKREFLPESERGLENTSNCGILDFVVRS